MIPTVALALDALRRGDPLGALRATEEATDPVVLALRGIALAQVDELTLARKVVSEAARAFEAREDALLAERAWLAEAEIALSDHDVGHARRALLRVAVRLEELGDFPNCAWALVVAARAATLQGDTDGAALLLERCAERTSGHVPAHVEATLAMARAELGARKLDASLAHAAAAAAREHATRSKNPTLLAEIDAFSKGLDAPAARLGDGSTLDLTLLAALLRGKEDRVVVDACGFKVWLRGEVALDLGARPLLFEILATLAASPNAAVHADDIARSVFGAKKPNESHDARLRVELGRLRALFPPELGELRREKRRLSWRSPRPIVLVSPLVPRREAHARALFSDGRAWSVDSLAQTMGVSRRTVQRLLSDLRDRHAIRVFGSGKATRYALEAGTERIASRMLLLGLIAGG